MGLRGRTLHLCIILLTGLLVYSNTFHAPFQWDEHYFISNNPAVKDISIFLEPSRAGEKYYAAIINRYVGYLSFALNYRIHGVDVTGYHVVNLVVHLLSALLVYFLVALTLKSPFLAASRLSRDSGYLALLTGLLFVTHPVQTGAVTYIFQRLASLSALFYVGSLVLYIKWRLVSINPSLPPLNVRGGEGGVTQNGEGEGLRGAEIASSRTSRKDVIASKAKQSHVAVYLLSLLSVVLAMKTKENAFTLPLVIAMYEFFFFSGRVRSRTFYLLPFLLTFLIIPLSYLHASGSFDYADESDIRRYNAFTPREYLYTQFRVMVTYIRLLFFPVDQSIAYDYPLYDRFLTPPVYLSLLFLLSVVCLGVYFLIRSRKVPGLRLPAFGIFFFFIALSVESSFVPLPMLINEYRLYLPSVGIFMVAGSLLFRNDGKRLALAVVAVVVLAVMAYARNGVWGNEIRLWEDAVIKAPNSAGAHFMLGTKYEAKGNPDGAIEHYEFAVGLLRDYAEAYLALGRAYRTKGMTDKAIERYEKGISLMPGNADAHYSLAVLYSEKGRLDRAIEHYEAVTALKPDFAEAFNNLGIAYFGNNQKDRTVENLTKAANLGFPKAYYNLGRAYDEMGMMEKAVDSYKKAVELDPSDADARNNLGLLYKKAGLREPETRPR